MQSKNRQMVTGKVQEARKLLEQAIARLSEAQMVDVEVGGHSKEKFTSYANDRVLHLSGKLDEVMAEFREALSDSWVLGRNF